MIHSPAYTAQEVAASAHVSGKRLAKTVVVQLDGKVALAVIASDQTVDMSLLRAAAGAQYAESAEKSDFAERFEGCQLGAMRPFGNLFGMDTHEELARRRQLPSPLVLTRT
ncbi:hypothetical protein BH09PLA1_BH09PLA1_00340 [soil metagenome]